MGGLVSAAVLPFAGALALNLLSPPRSRRAGWLASGFVAASFALVARAAASHLHSPATWAYGWIPSLGVDLSIRADGLSLLFALLITGVGVVVFTYAAAYLGPNENRRRFFCYLLTFMGAMLGVVLSWNLIALFVFWELTSVSSFLLIGFWHGRARSRNGALKALVVTSSGGLALLVGFVMIGSTCGSFDIGEIIARRDLLAASPWAPYAASLVILGAITKSAQLPFHFWLPSAMEAPTPVSAYLHAATMVKAGLYLVVRLGPALSGIALWTPTLTVIALATMTWGSWMALRQTDLKALLAFSTVSQLGLILALLAPSSPEATSAGLLHVLNHGVFKGALFLLVGIVEHEAHTRNVLELGPLRRTMPRTHALIALAALSMAGLPPFGGFVSKELFLEHVLALGTPLAVLAVGGAALTAAYCFALAVGLAWGRGKPSADAAGAHDPGASLLWGPCLLVGLAIALGLWPQAMAGGLVEAATGAALAAQEPHLHLALWHGPSPALMASIGAVAAGFALYALWWQPRTPPAPLLLADRAYDAFLEGLQSVSRRVTDAYMSGLLWRYVGLIYAVVLVALAASALAGNTGRPAIWNARAAQPFEVAAIAATGLAAVGAAFARTRLAAILALGANGYLLALLFSLLGAPDLSLTQVMVETVSVVLFLAVFVYLPPYSVVERRRLRPFHLALSAAVGGAVATVLYLARGYRVMPTISSYYLEASAEKAGGHNVVNVILVDFRGLDTMGEITVLGVAALACFAIIKLHRGVSA